MNVRYSESDTLIRTPKLDPSEDELGGDPKPGPSGTNKCGPPAKSKAKESKKFILLIKFPEKTPIKKNEEVPLSKLTPRIVKPPAKLDLRERQDAMPASSEPRNDSATSGHMRWGTAHRSRSFIVGKTTSRNNSTMTVQEDEAPGIDGDVEEEEEEEDGFNDPRGEDEKINK